MTQCYQNCESTCKHVHVVHKTCTHVHTASQYYSVHHNHAYTAHSPCIAQHSTIQCCELSKGIGYLCVSIWVCMAIEESIAASNHTRFCGSMLQFIIHGKYSTLAYKTVKKERRNSYRKERKKQHVKAVQGYIDTNNQPQWLRKHVHVYSSVEPL